MVVENKNFKSDKHCVACHIIYDGKILYIKRKSTKPQGGRWGCIAGKVEKGENDLTAIQREVKEETGLDLNKKDFKYISSWNMVFDKKEKNCDYSSFDFCLYQVHLNKRPEIILPQDELDEYDWFTPEEALNKKLFQDEDCVLRKEYF